MEEILQTPVEYSVTQAKGSLVVQEREDQRRTFFCEQSKTPAIVHGYTPRTEQQPAKKSQKAAKKAF